MGIHWVDDLAAGARFCSLNGNFRCTQNHSFSWWALVRVFAYFRTVPPVHPRIGLIGATTPFKTAVD
jgi:hypothetical protein